MTTQNHNSGAFLKLQSRTPGPLPYSLPSPLKLSQITLMMAPNPLPPVGKSHKKVMPSKHEK